MDKTDIKKVLAGVSLVGLLAGGVTAINGCATTDKQSSCTGKKMEKSSCTGEKSSCTGDKSSTSTEKSSCTGESGCNGKK